jgi:diguanylate cyclase (GGDEF)-like protein
VAVSITVFSAGMILSPLWQGSSAGAEASGAVLSAAAYDSVFLCGYYLMMMAGIMRITDTTHEWRVTMSRPIDTDAVWPSSLLSAVVLVSVALMGRWAYGVNASVAEAALYVTFATIATIALVARTGVFSFETGTLQTTSTTDPVTGALNHRAFQELVGSQVADARRKHERFAVAFLDLDGFAAVNAAIGHSGGDEVLERVARALVRAAGRRGMVFRLSGDEFAVVAPSVSEHGQQRFGTDVLGVVAAARPIEGVPLSASVGVAMGDGASTPEELLQRAGAAEAWAKYHGKGRVVVYDERIVRALGVEDRLRLHEERAHIDVARALAAAADARDTHNYYHSRNVAALSVLLGEEIGLPAGRVREIEVAAMLHDVGKIALSEDLLGGTALTAAQERETREHAALGAQLVESLSMEPLPEWIRAHHERWDGGGYPDGLAGESIPLEARIIALADAYDAMTSGKQTGVAYSKAAALQEIDHGMGSRFDPEIAERFIEVVAQTSSLGWSDEWPSR